MCDCACANDVTESINYKFHFWTESWLLKVFYAISVITALSRASWIFVVKQVPVCNFIPGKCSTCTPSVYFRKSIWPVSADQLTCINKRRIWLLSLMLVYISNSTLAVNKRMSYAVAMNMNNTDTSSSEKYRGSLKILHLAYKNGGFKTLCRDSVCLCYATLPFFVGYYQSK